MTKRETAKGISLARGPVGLVGLVLLAYGNTALIFGGHGFTLHVPSGAVHGKTWRNYSGRWRRGCGGRGLSAG
jgi:hypothetical protein